MMEIEPSAPGRNESVARRKSGRIAIGVEATFSYPALGYLFYTATTNHDLPLMQGLFLFYTLAVLICVLLADFITAVLDPPTREA